MRRQMSIVAFILISLGSYFLLQSFNIPFLTTIQTNDAILMIIGGILLIHGYMVKDEQNVFGGTIVLTLGIHFHGLNTYSFWPDHWSLYIGMIGLAFVVRYFFTRKGFLPGMLLIIITLFMLFSHNMWSGHEFMSHISTALQKFWPLLCIIFGIYLLKRK